MTGAPAATDARLVAVTGMHRSGTSLATRIIQLAGASLGREDGIAPPGRDNPTGYWENRYVTELNDEILAHLGGSWDQPPVLVPGWEDDPGLVPYRERILALVDAYYPDAATLPTVCKDPRLSLLLPLWRTLVAVPTTVVVVRHPREVAASLLTRNRMPADQAALLWLRYVVCATRQDPGHLLLTHAALLEDLSATIARIAGHLGLTVDLEDVERRARDHLDPDLRHHTHEAEPAADDDPITRLALSTWQDGTLRLDALPAEVADAIAEGWLRPPVDTEALTTARAKVVELTETLRRKNRQDRARAAGAPSSVT